jgi:hypothetical protein
VDVSPGSPAVAQFDRLFGRGAGAGGGGAYQAAAAAVPVAPAGSEPFTLASVLGLFSRATHADAAGGGAHATAAAARAGEGGEAGGAQPGGGGGAARPAASSAGSTSAPGAALPSVSLGVGLPLQTLIAHMPRARKVLFVDVVAWLLKQGYLRQMHTYVYLLWPFHAHSRERGASSQGASVPDAAARGGGSAEPWQSASSAAFVAAPGGAGLAGDWTPQELAHLERVTAEKPASLTPLCVRLVAYLRDTLRLARAGMGVRAAGDDLPRGEQYLRHAGSGDDDEGEDDFDDGDEAADDRSDDGGSDEGGASGLGLGRAVAAAHGRRAGARAPHGPAASASGAPPPASLLGLRFEEVMWRLRVSRADLQMVLAAFPSLFVTSSHS